MKSVGKKESFDSVVDELPLNNHPTRKLTRHDQRWHRRIRKPRRCRWLGEVYRLTAMARQDHYRHRLPKLVRAKAEAYGERGRVWMIELDECVDALQQKWNLQLGDVLSGGSESLVLSAITEDGKPAVLKIGLRCSTIAMESKVLQIARGRGYAQLYEVDVSSNAMVLERLGHPISSTYHTVDEHERVICAALNTAWIPMNGKAGWITGAVKAESTARFIAQKWRILGKPCTRKTLSRVRAYVEERVDAFAADDCFLVHGDAHGYNTLHAPEGGYRFIDPQGVLAERACDLGCLMRGWSSVLLGGDTAKLARMRCARLAALCDVDESSVWQWGFIERVAVGLILLEVGREDEGRDTLEVADRLSREP
jgi:streptomycin 6-kinase